MQDIGIKAFGDINLLCAVFLSLVMVLVINVNQFKMYAL